MELRNKFSRKRVSMAIAASEKRTKSSFKDECDVNQIMKKYLKTGKLPGLVSKDPKYGDFSDVPSYQEALDRVLVAQTAFDALPAAVRAECYNDPAVFLDRVRDREWASKHKLALPPSKKDLSLPGGSQEAPKGAAATQQGSDSQSPNGAK